MKLRVKRYKNKKLYDLDLHKYINLDTIKDAIRDNISVEVTNFNGEDYTNDALINILKDCKTNKGDLIYLIKQGV